MRPRKSACLAPFTPLSTHRLSLVAIGLEHAPSIFAYASNPEISRLVAWPRHENIETSRRFAAQVMVGYAEGGHYEWGVVRRSDQAFIGTCGFGQIDFARSAGDINYVLAKPYWGKGYATEAVGAVLHFGFGRLGLRLIEAQAFQDNIASIHVMAKLGLRYRETRPMSPESGPLRPVSVWQIECERDEPSSSSCAGELLTASGSYRDRTTSYFAASFTKGNPI